MSLHGHYFSLLEEQASLPDGLCVMQFSGQKLPGGGYTHSMSTDHILDQGAACGQ